MIVTNNNVFLLQTKNTAYMFRRLESGHLEHLHYGGLLFPNKNDCLNHLDEVAATVAPKHFNGAGNLNNYSDEHSSVMLEQLTLEMSSFGKGDIRDPFVELTYADGSSTVDFLYECHKVTDGKKPLSTLPSSYAEDVAVLDDKIQQLVVTLKDKEYGARLKLIYSVFPECDVITRSAVLSNESKEDIRIDRILSTCVDFNSPSHKFTSFHGRWADEMGKYESICSGGKVVSEELAAGESGSRSNPLVIVSSPSADDFSGDCYGFNLIYSGNHYEALSSNGNSMSRFVSGIQPVGFSWILAPGSKFEAPEAVMTYSDKGMNAMSINMQDFVREHIVRGTWKKKERPILINSWEASYFNITQNSLVSLAKEAKKCGIELFVMDDGWFGKRNNDNSSLGDWYENKKKLPGGIKELANKITDLGMSFGLWVEPEMVNEDSDLYRSHPEWAVTVPGHPHSKGRNQMNLDLTRDDVQDYVIDTMKKVFSSGKVSYVKWDMNRIFSDRYSTALAPEKQGEFQHRYYIGLYRIMKELTESFPEILFEGCSAGGNRFDLGILCYFPQIWGSDDTDAMCRVDIQRGYSYGYPASTIGAHVSACPNHQTLNTVPMETRFEVAAAGCFGYELNLCDMSEADKKLVSDQVEFYKKHRKLFQFGDYYRLPDNSYIIVSKDKTKAVAFVVEKNARPNNDYRCLRTVGLDDYKLYNMTGRKVPHSLKDFGSLVNTQTPIHVKQDGILHTIMDKVVNMSGEEQKETATGASFNNHGVALNSSFCGTGNNEGTRIMRTGDTRLYVFEEVK